MSELVYNGPAYAMGFGADSNPAGDTPAAKKQAEIALKSMRRKLKKWLRVRKRMNDYSAGLVTAPTLWRRPGAKPLPASVVARTLLKSRAPGEQDLAETLHALLVECGADPTVLPIADVSKDQNAAAKLATIIVSGKTPTEAASPQSQGLVWFVLAIPVAGVVLVLSQLIQSRADVQIAKEERLCKESGACTDEGFWLKIASVSVLGWLAWDKMGLREAAKDAFKKKR